MEYRRFTNTVEDRDKESRSVSGYASVFNSESRDLGFFETIAPGAITEETIKESDVFATLNHDPDKVLARSNHGVGSLELFVDERGLHYRYDAPHTDLGDSVLEHIDRGDLTDASFAFTIADEPDAQRWEKRDGKIYRTIYKIDRLYDISNVWTGAYAEASTHRNSPDEYEKYINELNAQEEIAKREAEQERVNKINENLDNKLKEFYKNIKI
jgi:hypothetical protein